MAMKNTTTDTVWVEVDAELIQAIDTLAHQHEHSVDATLQKCLIRGINHHSSQITR